MSWRYAVASVAGRSHVAENRGCEDAHSVRIVGHAELQANLLVAVADGAGSASHGALGARLACESILDQAAAWIALGECPAALAMDTAHAWLDGVRETFAFAAEEHDLGMRELATTLMFAMIGPNASAFWQIGDGAMVVSEAEDDWAWVFWPQHGAFANETNFVTDPAASDNLAFAVSGHEIRELAVFTDGLERLLIDQRKRAVQTQAFERMVAPLRTLHGNDEIPQLSEALKAYLSSPTVTGRTDDDVTLVIATRRDSDDRLSRCE